jgi:CheY-like chemotaxis protein
MDGAEVVSRVRANPAWRSLPIVVVTARDEMMTIEAAAGPLIIARAEGLTPNDVVRLAQDLGGVSNSHATILT